VSHERPVEVNIKLEYRPRGPVEVNKSDDDGPILLSGSEGSLGKEDDHLSITYNLVEKLQFTILEYAKRVITLFHYLFLKKMRRGSLEFWSLCHRVSVSIIVKLTNSPGKKVFHHRASSFKCKEYSRQRLHIAPCFLSRRQVILFFCNPVRTCVVDLGIMKRIALFYHIIINLIKKKVTKTRKKHF
jgi:hypothetical protein